MARLFLLRHARAGLGGPATGDRDRPLTESGRAEASRVGRTMHARGWRPDLVLCSPARRTLETWGRVEPELGGGDEIRLVVSNVLYEGDADRCLALIRAAPAAQAVLVVGHNPAMEALATALPASGDAAARRALATGFPASGLAAIALAGPLSGLVPGTGTLEAFLRPERGG